VRVADGAGVRVLFDDIAARHAAAAATGPPRIAAAQHELVDARSGLFAETARSARLYHVANQQQVQVLWPKDQFFFPGTATDVSTDGASFTMVYEGDDGTPPERICCFDRV